MLRSFFALFVGLQLANPAVAQVWQNSAAQKPAGPLAAPPLEAPQEAPAQQPTGGYYAAPPQTGTFAGPSNSVGIDGPALHFPAITLKLPTLQLPSLTSLRKNAHMKLSPGEAPYVQQLPVAMGAPIAIQSVPAASPAAAGPAQSPPAAESPPAEALPEDAYQKSQYQKGAALDAERRQEVAELRLQVQLLAQSMERMARMMEEQADQQRIANSRSFNSELPIRWSDASHNSQSSHYEPATRSREPGQQQGHQGRTEPRRLPPTAELRPLTRTEYPILRTPSTR